jgi:hypothetical protein
MLLASLVSLLGIRAGVNGKSANLLMFLGTRVPGDSGVEAPLPKEFPRSYIR